MYHVQYIYVLCLDVPCTIYICTLFRCTMYNINNMYFVCKYVKERGVDFYNSFEGNLPKYVPSIDK